MKPGTETKLKFKQLKRRLKLPHWQIVGVLETLWRVTESNAPAGDIGKLSDEEIAAAFEWDGDASELVAALVDCKFLDLDATFRLVVHDWSDHCPNHLKGALAKHNIEFANIVARHRARDPAKQDTEQSAKQVAKDGANLTVPCLSVPNLALPNHSCVETAEPSSAPPSLLVFPCDGAKASWELTESAVAEWKKLFPSLDIMAECRGALAWILASPTRKKTAGGMRRFLVGWFGRSQNSGRKTDAPTTPPPIATAPPVPARIAPAKFVTKEPADA